ncbi:MAG TPA: hypothetical protein VG146_20125 [Verrucomicrobiae bacterium]|nr:hypothetical protein [Verrucomicrobiae bacterium]
MSGPPRVALDPVAEAAKRALTAQGAAEALDELRRLCVAQTEDTAPLEAKVEQLRLAGYRQELNQVLQEALSSPQAHPHVGALWMRRLVSSNNWDRRYPQGMDQLCRRGEIGRRAVIEFLQAAGASRKGRLVCHALRKHGKWLRTHPQGWRAAARALADVREYRRLARWMSSWRTKPELDGELLYCLALGLRGTGHERKAQPFVRQALEKPDAEKQFPVLKLWAAQEEALAGDVQAAEGLYKELKSVAWDDDSVCVYYLTRGVLRVRQAARASRKEVFDSASTRVQERVRRVAIYKRDVMLRRQYRRCLWRMAVDSGRWGSGAMAAWRSAESVWLLLPLALVPGLQLFLPLYLFRLCARRRGFRKKRPGF